MLPIAVEDLNPLDPNSTLLSCACLSMPLQWFFRRWNTKMNFALPQKTRSRFLTGTKVLSGSKHVGLEASGAP